MTDTLEAHAAHMMGGYPSDRYLVRVVSESRFGETTFGYLERHPFGDGDCVAKVRWCNHLSGSPMRSEQICTTPHPRDVDGEVLVVEAAGLLPDGLRFRRR